MEAENEERVPSDQDEIASPSEEEHESDAGEEDGAKSDSEEEEVKRDGGNKSDSEADEEAKQGGGNKSDSEAEEEAKHEDVAKGDSDEEEEAKEVNGARSDSEGEEEAKREDGTKSDSEAEEEEAKHDSEEEMVVEDEKGKSESEEETSRRGEGSEEEGEGGAKEETVRDKTMTKSDSEEEEGQKRDNDVAMRSASEDEEEEEGKGQEVAKSESEDEVVREDVESEAGSEIDKDSDVEDRDNLSDHHSVASRDGGEVDERASIHSEGEAPSSPPKEDDKKESDESEDESEDSSDDEDSDPEQAKVGELIADIFGESDEDEEFEGFGEEDVAAAKKKKEKKKQHKVLSDSEGEAPADQEESAASRGEEGDVPGEEAGVPPPPPADDDREEGEEEVSAVGAKVKKKKLDLDSDDDDVGKAHIVYDFDLMLEKKKEESSRRRKFKNVDIINDSDDLIADLLTQMKTAADEDRDLNKKRVAATKKLKMLPLVVSQLNKLDLKVAFLDQGVLGIMNEWLMPLPDRSLPHLQIRTHLLRLLGEFPPIDQGALKTSGIGRAVMYLYKHPKETRENKDKAGKLISEWSRPIFNLNTNFSSMSKEEREHRDFEHMPKKRKLRLESGEDASEDISSALTGDDRSLKPGEKGWVGRARVPLPSMRDYVVRPKWNVDTEFSKSAGRKSVTRLDKHVRILKERKKQSKIQRAVTISIEGRKMSL